MRLAPHAENPRVAVAAVGVDVTLPGVEAHHREAQLLDGHRLQRHGHLLATGQEHIQLPAGAVGVDLLRLCNQVVGGVALGREHHDHVVAPLIRIRNALRHAVETLGVRHRRTAEFHYD